MRRKISKALTEDQRRLRQLENDLYFAQRTALSLLRPAYREILLDSAYLRSRGDIGNWYRKAIDKVIDAADVIVVKESLRESRRAVCPLCGESAQDFYRPGPGYVYPEGLRQHLLGTRHGTQCDVAKIAFEHAISNAEATQTFNHI